MTGARPLSARLREATREEHEHAESAPFITALLAGQLDRTAYHALLGQSYFFYTALEDVGKTWRDDEVVGPFISKALERTAALEADLEWLTGPGWRAGLALLRSTERYAHRIRTVCASSPSAFVAHHYTRYLGDLSGGQIVRRKLMSIYGLTSDGLRFYSFDDIERPKLFKDTYRQRLDDAPWTAAEQDNLLAEANEAFRLNRAVFDDLARELAIGGRSCEG
ncbi:biliverdin-producing heme oxygenase [Saccharomonospora sp. NPDC046836]|uniref:biliverdin-producing heme oxygenase n=1 Tax=Saccharomonospora sp. NPDC046836 TaxID=3156921 RepID=UPI0033EB7E40